MLVTIEYSDERDIVQEFDRMFFSDYIFAKNVKIDIYEVLGRTITFYPVSEKEEMEFTSIYHKNNGLSYTKEEKILARKVVVTEINSYVRNADDTFHLFSTYSNK